MSQRPEETAMEYASRALRELARAMDQCNANIRETRRREFEEWMERARTKRLERGRSADV